MSESKPIKISFGIIVLNGEPFTKHCLRALYPFAHQIIVVEGATENARSISTLDGHSTDQTLESLKEFKANEDPKDKLVIISREGFWKEKDEMSKAYAKVVTGNILWQVDVDEFYLPEDIQKIISILSQKLEIETISVNTVTFWGGIDYLTEGWHLIRGNKEYHRIFRFEPGYEYRTHRPPTVMDQSGRDLRKKNPRKGWVRGRELEKKYGIRLYHYSLLLPKQVQEKSRYYAAWARPDSVRWAEENYFKLSHPFHVHNVYEQISWLERYRGKHPPEISRMWSKLKDNHPETIRDNSDIERLLGSWWYNLGSIVLKMIGNLLLTKHLLKTKIVRPKQ